jgi:hypothetical protein
VLDRFLNVFLVGGADAPPFFLGDEVLQSTLFHRFAQRQHG